jgi:cytochrome c-type biogenesis protein CcmE
MNSKNKLSFSFDMIDKNGKIESVFYGEPMPPDFLLSEQIVVIGSYNEESFIANEILLKCPSKYTENNIKL